MKRTNNSTFFRELAMLIETGIDIREAILQLNPKPIEQWLSATQQLQQGDAFHRVLAGKNLLSRYEKEILEVSESAGRLNEGLRFLADSHESRRLRLSKLRSKLAYPFLVLTAAIVVSALFTALNNPGIPVFSILSTAMLWFLFAVFLTKLLMNLMSKDGCALLEAGYVFNGSEWYRQLFQQIVFGALLWQVKSGIDFKSSFLRTARIVNNKPLTKKLRMVSAGCGQGQSVTQSSSDAELPLTDGFKAILQTAEESGDWSSSLEHYLVLQAHTIEDTIDTVYEWTPRLYYLFVVFIVLPVIF